MPARDPWRPARAPRRLLFPTRAENGLPFPLPGPERGRPGAPHCSRVLGRDCRRLATSASAPNSRTEELRGRRVATAVWTVPDPPSLEAVILALSISVYAAPREEKQVCDLDQGSGTKKSHSPCTYRTGRGPSKNDPECTMLKLRAEKTQI
ncbi:uncharacterized protein [Manis javanica]|uniref:uncharacterized protein isoform X1 n=1 Tax=Manis javanica TaxID=9974 RepID=UPI003C6CDDE4